jgi:hypothetical protein
MANVIKYSSIMDPNKWEEGTQFPFGKVSTVVAAHSGDSSGREWCDEYSTWLFPNEFILKADNGRVFKVHVSEIG